MTPRVPSPLARTLLGLAVVAAASGLRAQPAELGSTAFPTSGRPEAQEHFIRGLLLLHSFEYPDAAEEFREAERIQPDFAMAFWGEAMTYNHPIWMERDRDAALKALARLAPTAQARRAKAPTERERMYLDAVETLYAEGDKASRDRAYAESMRRLHERFPEDLDAAAFYALALLGSTEGKRDFPVFMRAAAVAEDVFAANPKHPGAAHYLIHCYDDPVHAPLGMRAARVYAKIAPAAVHALHMPSHIFLASGLWADTVASNEASWKASVDRADRRSLGPAAHSSHALSWLEYADLQLGRWNDARRTLEQMEKDAEGASGHAADELSAMRAAWIVETGRCSPGASRPAGSSSSPRDLFVRGSCALASGDAQGAADALDALRNGQAPDDAKAHEHGGAAGYDRQTGEAAKVMALALEARIALARGESERAETLARRAAAAEDAMTFEAGPPVVVKPAHELAGEILLEIGKPAEARREFETSLARTPGRSRSLLGLARAASKSGDAAAAADAYARLASNWKGADEVVPELREARASR
jgi:tetratricopeptide (TPR) repeat protein